jgi:citrate synthase
MKHKHIPTTAISRFEPDKIFVRGANLVDDLMGQLSFTEMILFHLLGQRPTKFQTKVLDAVMVTTMEHGFTPSAIATRLIFHSAPEALQAAVAAGVMGAGSTYLGTMEGCAALLAEMVASKDGLEASAKAIVQRFRASESFIPGLGHPFHRPDDPRAPKLLEIAQDAGAKGDYIAALKALHKAANEAYPKYLTTNATGAIAAILLEAGIKPAIMRGIAVISRAAGLVGHISEEMDNPSGRYIYDMVDSGIKYSGD